MNGSSTGALRSGWSEERVQGDGGGYAGARERGVADSGGYTTINVTPARGASMDDAGGKRKDVASVGGADKAAAGLNIPHAGFWSCTAYCTCSTIMVLLNKTALSTYEFPYPNSLVFFQNLVTLCMVCLAWGMGYVKISLSWKTARQWVPVNMIFVGMIVTGALSLKFMAVAMVTIFKNLANIFTITGDKVIFGKNHHILVWGSLGLMVMSALVGGLSDLSFSKVGYTWMAANCLFTASYALGTRKAMDIVKLDEFNMVFYNNILSLPLLLFLAVTFDELPGVFSADALSYTGFHVAAWLSGILGMGISFSSLWCIRATSSTTFATVGSLNKVPQAMLGIVLFHAPTSILNLFGLSLGLASGFCFAYAKIQESKWMQNAP